MKDYEKARLVTDNLMESMPELAEVQPTEYSINLPFLYLWAAIELGLVTPTKEGLEPVESLPHSLRGMIPTPPYGVQQ